MCDPSLTDVGGRSSEFPDELDPWREVDLTDVEEKMKGLKMEQEGEPRRWHLRTSDTSGV